MDAVTANKRSSSDDVKKVDDEVILSVEAGEGKGSSARGAEQVSPHVLDASVRAEQITVRAAQAGESRPSPTVAAQWYEKPLEEGFKSVVRWDKLATTKWLYPTVGIIEQYEPQETRAGHELELMRLGIATFQKYARTWTTKRELYLDRVKRTADSQLGVNLRDALLDAERQTQVDALSDMLRTLSDGDVDPLLDRRDPALFRRSACVLLPVERSMMEWLQAWIDETFYSDSREFIEYMVALSIPSVKIIPPQYSPYELRQLMSPRAWGMTQYHDFVRNNPSIWPDLARTYYARVQSDVPTVSMGSTTLQSLEGALSPNLTAVSTMDSLFTAGSNMALTQRAAQDFWGAMIYMCVCNYRSRVTFAAMDQTQTMASMMAMLSLFAFPTWFYAEEDLNIVRNMIVRMLVRLTTWNDVLATSGEVDYSLRTVNATVPQPLHDWLHQPHRSMVQPMPDAVARYEGGVYRDAFAYPMGYRVDAPDEDTGGQQLMLRGIADFLNQARSATTLSQPARRKLSDGVNALLTVVHVVPALMLRIQHICMGVTQRAGCIVTPPEQFAYSGTNGFTFAVPLSGAMSLLYATPPAVPPYTYDSTLRNFHACQAIGSTMAAVNDAYNLVRGIAATRKWFVSDKITAVSNVFKAFGPSNWLSDLLLKSMVELPLKRQLIITGDNGPWHAAITYCRDIVVANPSLYGFTDHVYVHQPAILAQAVGTNVSYLWSPARLPTEFVSQAFVEQNLLYQPDLMRAALHGMDGMILEVYVKVKSEIFHRNASPVPQQYADGMLVLREAELPVSVNGTVKYYITTVDDATRRLLPKDAAARPPTLSIDDPGMIRPDIDFTAYVRTLINYITTRRENRRLVSPMDFMFVVLPSA